MTRPICKGRTEAGKPCQSTILNPDGFCETPGPGGDLKMKLRAKMGSMKAEELEAIQAELAEVKRTNSPGTAPAGLEKRFSLFPLGTE